LRGIAYLVGVALRRLVSTGCNSLEVLGLDSPGVPPATPPTAAGPRTV